jgi:hypothetical protein
MKTLQDCPTPFLIVAALLVVAPEVLIAVIKQGAGADGPQVERMLSLAEGLTVGAIGQGALIYAALKVIGVGRVSAGECLSAGVRLWGPVLGINILAGLGSLLGLILLIVPGLFLAVAWSVALPIRIAGKPGVGAALEKSFEMTRGSRWMIFAIWLVLIVVAVVVFGLVSAITAIATGLDSPVLEVIVAPLLAGIAGIGAALVYASIYEDLVLVTGQGGATRTADVFD